jgi:uncharacterized membrane-anchored protein YhcB (DUF1043 family)
MVEFMWAVVALAAVVGLFGWVWYGIYVIGKAISGRSNRKELEALRTEVAQLRQEFSTHLYGQDGEIQRLGERLRSVEQALPAVRAGAAAEDRTAQVRLPGS